MRRVFLSLCFLLLSVPAFAVGGAPEVTLGEGKVSLTVALSILSSGAGVVTVTNTGEAPLRAAHPLSRGAVSFFISDAQGNPVAPEFTAKADPAAQTHDFAPGAAEPFVVSLEMVTGTGKLEYRLEKGKVYRAIAIYRPAGLSGPGFASREVSFTYDGLPDNVPEGTRPLVMTCRTDDDCLRFRPACSAAPCPDSTQMSCRDNMCVIQ